MAEPSSERQDDRGMSRYLLASVNGLTSHYLDAIFGATSHCIG